MQQLKKELYGLIKSNEIIFEFIQDECLDGLWYMDLQQQDRLWADAKLYRALGHTTDAPPEVLQQALHPEDRQRLRELLEQASQAQKPVQYDEVVRYYHKNGQLKWFRCRSKTICTPNAQAPNRMIGAHLDITTEKQMEQQALRDAQMFQSMLNNQASFVVRINPEGKYTFVNDYYCKTLETEREALIGQKSIVGIHPDDHHKVREAGMKCFQQPGRREQIRLRKLLPKSGKTNISDWDFVAMEVAEGSLELFCTGVDVTEKVAAEEALRKSEEYYRFIAENTSDGILVMENNRIIYCSPSYEQKIGSTLAELADKKPEDLFEMIHPDDRERIHKIIYDGLDKKVKELSYQYRFIRSDGSQIWREDHVNHIYDENQELLRSVLVARDITERKQAEQEIREKQELLTEIADSMPGFVLRYHLYPDGTDKVSFISEGCNRLFGIAPEAVQAGTEALWKVVPPEALKSFEESVKRSAQTLETWQFLTKTVNQNGEQLWMLCLGNPKKQTDGSIVWTSIILDVSDRVQAEEMLKERTEMLTGLSDNLPGAILRLKSDRKANFKLEYVSQGIEELLGVNREAALADEEALMASTHPQDRKMLEEAIGYALKTLEPLDVVYRALPNSEQNTWIHVKAQPKEAPDGSIMWNALLLNISEQKAVEEMLQESNRQLLLLENFVNLSSDGIQVMNEAGYLVYANKAVAYNNGISLSDYTKIHIGDYVPYFKNREHWRKHVQELKQLNGQPFLSESKHYNIINEEIFPAEVSAIGQEVDGTYYIIAISRDITERKLAEEKLIEERKLLRTIIDNIPINIYVKNHASEKVLANRAEYIYSGFASEQELIGKSDLDYYPEHIANRNMEEDRQVFTTGKGIIQKEAYTEWPEGRVEYFLKSKLPLKDARGKVKALVGIGMDITERKLAEIELQKTKELLEQAGEIAKFGGWDFDLETGKVNWSYSTYKIFEVPPDFIPTLENSTGFYPDADEVLRPAITHAIATGEGYELVLRLVTAKKNEKWVKIIGKPEMHQGKCVRLYGSVLDISELREKELALERANELLHSAGKLAKFGAWEYLPHKEEVFWSDTVRNIYEVSEDYTPSLHSVLAFFPDEKTKAFAQDKIEQAISKGISYDLELPIVTAKGRKSWIRAVGFPEMVHGKIVRIFGFLLDIEDIKKAEIELRSAKEILEQTSKVAKVGGWTLELATGEITWTDMVWEIYGVPHEFVPDLENTQAFYKEGKYRERVAQSFTKCTENGKPCHLETLILTPNGEEKWVRIIAYPEADDMGVVRRLFGTVQDINAQKKASMQLEIFKNVFEQIDDGLGISMVHNQERLVNQAFVDMMEYASKEELVRHSKEGYLSKDSAFIDKITQELVAGNFWKGDVQLLTKHGNKKDIYLSAGPIRNEKGEMIAIYGIHSDISERKAAEVALLHAKERAEAASRAKSEFLANMSHEIRTPLNSVIGFSELLVKTKLDNTQKQYMQAVNQSAHSLLDLINDILDFSKIEAGKLELAVGKTDIWELTANVAEILRYKASEKALDLNLYLSQELPQFLWIDPVRIRQVLINLMSNAVKFTEQGEVSIRIEPVGERDKKRQTIRFAVIDTGIGIPETKQRLIFEAFSQEDGSITRKYGGTGLGLTISNQLLRLMGTQLQLQSQPKKGSTFFFDLKTRTEQEGENGSYKPQQFKHILLVDDNTKDRQQLAELLQDWQLPFTEAKNGFDALEKVTVAPEQYDLLIIEQDMKIILGTEVIEKIRHRLQIGSKQLPIILSSKRGPVGGRKTWEALGVTTILNKPVGKKQLSDAMRAIKAKHLAKEEETSTTHSKEASSFHVLIVDDNAVNRMLAKSLVLSVVPQAQVTEAPDGKIAVEHCQTQSFDLIFMDIQMPEMSGYEATRKIRENSNREKHMPIIALTAGTIKGERERCLAAGMDDYLSKPIVIEKMEAVVQQWFSNTQVAASKEPESNTVTTDQKQRFNKAKFLKNTGDDEEVIAEILALFAQKLPEQLQSLAQAVELREDKQQVQLQAHSLKGTALNCCMEILADLAWQLEHLKPFSWDKADKLMKDLQQEGQHVLELLRNRNH